MFGLERIGHLEALVAALQERVAGLDAEVKVLRNELAALKGQRGFALAPAALLGAVLVGLIFAFGTAAADHAAAAAVREQAGHTKFLIAGEKELLSMTVTAFEVLQANNSINKRAEMEAAVSAAIAARYGVEARVSLAAGPAKKTVAELIFLRYARTGRNTTQDLAGTRHTVVLGHPFAHLTALYESYDKTEVCAAFARCRTACSPATCAADERAYEAAKAAATGFVWDVGLLGCSLTAIAFSASLWEAGSPASEGRPFQLRDRTAADSAVFDVRC